MSRAKRATDPEAGGSSLEIKSSSGKSTTLSLSPEAVAVDATQLDKDDLGIREHKLKAKPNQEKQEASMGRKAGTVGRLFLRFGYITWLFMVAIPILASVLIFGVIPLGFSQSTSVGSQAVFWFITNPSVYCVVAYVTVVAFLGCHGDPRPFKSTVSIAVLASVYVALAAIVGPLLTIGGTWNLFGFASLGITYVVICAVLFVYDRFVLDKTVDTTFSRHLAKFSAIVALFIVFYGVLVAYLVAFRQFGRTGQIVLPICLALVVFIFRKTMLSLTDPFDFDWAMVMAAFWFENLEDMFYVISFPQVKDPVAFITIFAATFFGNVANIAFLTTPWFRFRLWVKMFLKSVFTCNFPIPDTPAADEREIDNDRGHGPNRIGYKRRQIRFFLWKVLSQCIAMMFYLIIAPILRFGLNELYYPLSDSCRVTSDQFRNSMLYAAFNLVIVALSAFLGFFYIRRNHYVFFSDVRDRDLDNLKYNFNYGGFIVAVITYNAFLALSIIMQHQRIVYAFNHDAYIRGGPTPAPPSIVELATGVNVTLVQPIDGCPDAYDD